MQSPGIEVLLCLSGFAAALTVSWLSLRLALVQRKRMEPSPGAILRIRGAAGVYRSQVLSLSDSEWTISAPLQRDAFLALGMGESVVAEAAFPCGVLVFRSKVISIDARGHSVVLQPPNRIHRLDRRQCKRWPEMAGQGIEIEGQSGQILDLSEGGARIATAYRPNKGERVRLDMPWGEVVYAWVLSREGSEARVRFEEQTRPRPAKKETAPVV